MIRVKIIPPLGCDRSALDEKSWAYIPENSTVRDVLKLIKCNPIKAKMLLVSVNSEKTQLERTLQDGDVVSFFSIATGG